MGGHADGWADGHTGGRGLRVDEWTGGRTGTQAGERADERMGAGTLGGRADGGGQWADGRMGADGRTMDFQR